MMPFATERYNISYRFTFFFFLFNDSYPTFSSYYGQYFSAPTFIYNDVYCLDILKKLCYNSLVVHKR